MTATSVGPDRTIGGSPRTTEDQAIHHLHALLTQAGLHGMLMGHHQGVSVLSINSELTIWAYNGRLTWRHSNTDRHAPVSIHPIDDSAGAAHRILEHLGQEPSQEAQQEAPEQSTGPEPSHGKSPGPGRRLHWRQIVEHCARPTDESSTHQRAGPAEETDSSTAPGQSVTPLPLPAITPLHRDHTHHGAQADRQRTGTRGPGPAPQRNSRLSTAPPHAA